MSSESATSTDTASPFGVEEVAIATLTPHPRNYQEHPDDELDHIIASINEHGLYRNVVVSSDSYICAGHGVVEACRRMGLTVVPIYRLKVPHTHPAALKVLIGDNEIRHLAEVDDRALSEMLRELGELDDLLGTGYDEMMLANLVMVTRPAEEIEDLDAAAQYVGLPEYDEEGKQERIQIIVNFSNEDDRQEFCRLLGLNADEIGKEGRAKSIWWPKQVRHDLASVYFTDQTGDDSDDETDDDE